MSPREQSPESPDRPGWRHRLRDPAIGNVCAALALLVAVAAGIGLLRQGLFWLILSYFVLFAAVTFAVAFARRSAQKVRIVATERDARQLDIEDLAKELASTETDLAVAREGHEAAERGYATLRQAVIRIAQRHGTDIDDFDDELGWALRRLEAGQGAGQTAAP